MHISHLHIENFRNLSSQVVPLSPHINLITGDNGAGKTAILEAIYFLGRQRSFRTSKPKDLIQENSNYFRLIAKTTDPHHQIGLERRLEDDRSLSSLLRIDRETQKSPALLAKLVPIIAITARSFQIIDAGPQYRRQFIDYGTFQCDAEFFACWQQYERALKSRNAGLKQKMHRSVIDSFTPMLANAGMRVHDMRMQYFKRFKELLTKHLNELDFPYDVSIRYSPGWNASTDLLETLTKHFDYDYKIGHTRYGPHRADMRFSVEGGNADNRLSRGQQKTLILGMHLAQIELIGTYGDTSPLLMFDDIAAELDAQRRNHVLDYLLKFECQMFFSATEGHLFDASIREKASLIRLAHGKIIS